MSKSSSANGLMYKTPKAWSKKPSMCSVQFTQKGLFLTQHLLECILIFIAQLNIL